MLRAALYARYSSDNQRYESITAQLRASREYCKQRGYIVVKTYTDEAISGTSVAGRDAFQQMILDSSDDIFDVVIFHKIDRNARDEIDYYTNVDRLRKNGVRYEYSAEGIDVTTTNGKLTEGIKVAVAAWYSRNLAQEVRKGQKENALQAKFNGGRPPLGYKIVNQRYEIEPREAEAVRLIFDMYLHGSGYIEIAAELNRRGFVTRNGKPFAKNSLYEILGNERYTGTYIFNRIVTDDFGRRNNHKINDAAIKIPGAIPAIIDEETFAAVARRRELNKRRSSVFRAEERYLLSGKIICGECGSHLCGHRVKSRGQCYSYYCCSRRKLPVEVKCSMRMIQKKPLEDAVCEGILNMILLPDTRKTIIEEMQKGYGEFNDDIENKRRELSNEKVRAERKLSNLYRIIEDGDVDDFDLDRLKNAKAEVLAIRQELEKLPCEKFPPLAVQQINAAFDAFAVAVSNGEEKARQAVINFFLEQVVVMPENVEVFLNVSPCENFSVALPSPHLHHRHGNIKIKFSIPRSKIC